ncbi:MAG: metallopeptidase family protein [Actinomycetaceae bacterium]|nr:metallopeptidase family protein [Actinomycetaceae bacterium]
MKENFLPLRDNARQKDRHGRGIRGPLFSPTLPAWRTRAHKFDDCLAVEISIYQDLYPNELEFIEYGVRDVPESSPAPWEQAGILSKFFPSHKASPNVNDGWIIFYRMPIIRAAQHASNFQLFIHNIVTEQIAALLDKTSQEIDYLLH